MALELRAEPKNRLILEIAGVFLLIALWWGVSAMELVSRAILPTPLDVLKAFPDMHINNALVRNVLKSVWLNFQGYFWAILIAIPVGFLIGLIPIFRGLFSKQVDAVRFIPLTAVTGLFISWFGLGNGMKISFLAFGILVYLLPVVVQKIDEVEKVYLQTVYTLGANSWQTIRSVFLPAVLSKISDDIRVLVAISWTYIIVAEGVNKTGGVGELIWEAGRLGKPEKVFAILIIIMLIGFLQDKLFAYADRFLFPHKYSNR